MTENELSRLIERYESLVWTVVSGAISNRRDCEEVVADVFMSLWKGNFDPDAHGAKSFVIAVARRRAIDRLRLNRGDALPLPDELEPLADFETSEGVEKRLNREIIAEVINSLEPPDAEIFTRRYYYNHKVKEIARALGLKQSFVKSRLERAKDEIRRRLIARGINL